MVKTPSVLETNELSPSREDAPCNSLGASMTWIPPEPHPKPKDTKIRFWEAFQQTWATLAVHCMVIMVGMTLGFSAILLPQLEEAGSDIKITRADASWLASVVSIVAPIGSLGAGPVVQWLGSKKTIRLSLIPYALGWLLISFANGLPMLLAGRVITGLATTFGNTPCIVYITEVSSPHMRSMLTATGPTLGSLGILMAYVLGWLCSWRTVALVPAAWNLVCLIALATIPESPVWLVSHERFDEARRAIYWFHRVKPPADISLIPSKAKGFIKSIDVNGKKDISEDIIEHEDDDVAQRRKKAELLYALLMEEHSKKFMHCKEDKYGNPSDAGEKLLPDGSTKPVSNVIACGNSKDKNLGLVYRLKILFTKPTGLKPLIILTTIFLFQQYAGVYITLFYAVNVFKEMGGGALDEYIASIMVGLVRFLMSLVNIWLFRKFGRRPLCLLSALGMTVCMLTSGTSLYLTSIEEDVFSRNMMKFNDSLDHLNWSAPISSQPNPQSNLDVASGGTLNLNLSLFDQDQSPGLRSERSLNESSSEYSALNNLIVGNFSNDGIAESRYGKVNRTKERKDADIVSAHEERISPKFEILRKNNSLLEIRNSSNEVITSDASFSNPHASHPRKKISVIPTICMLLYVCVSMIGFLAIPWTITAELFPTEIRSLANSIVLSLANVLLFSALQAYPYMLDSLRPHGVLWMFALVSAAGGVFFYFFLPETHGRNLSEIEKYFSENTIYTYPCKKE